MKLVIFLAFAVFISTVPTDGRRKKIYKVNEGASTSRAVTDHGELTDEERCQLDECADSIAGLTFAEDLQGGDLRDMIANRYDELEAYADFIEAFYNYAKYGTNVGSDDYDPSYLLPNYRERLRYLHLRVYARITEILYQACERHIHQEFAYIYNRRERSFQFMENIMVNSDVCMCTNAQQRGPSACAGLRRQTTRTLNIRAGRARPPKFLYVDNRGHNPNNLRLSQHHIIPMSLIARFFQIWMNSQVSSPRGSLTGAGENVEGLNGCIKILNSRLKRSVEKIMVYNINKINKAAAGDYLVNHDISSVVRDNYFNEFFQSLWAHSGGGNVIVGPSERGPLDPSFGRMGDDIFNAFEVDCEPIIGRQRYQEMWSLYQRLLRYIDEAPRASAFRRMRDGADLFVTMVMTFEQYDITLMNENQWELRRLSPQELSQLSPRLQYIYRYKKFWAIKQPSHHRRTHRSSSNTTESCDSMESFSRRRWSEFVESQMQLSLEAEDSNKTSPLSCALAKLYFDYRFFSSSAERASCSHANFETHLYTIISRSREWRECISHTAKAEEWCLAWRRIMLNSRIGIERDYHDNEATARQSQQLHHQDSELLLQWVLKQVSTSDNSSAVAELSHASGSTAGSGSYVCYDHHGYSSTPACPNHCHHGDASDVGLTGKMVYVTPDAAYNQVWFMDVDHKLKCRCSNDKIDIDTSHSSSTGFDCNDPRYSDSIRCTDLRR